MVSGWIRSLEAFGGHITIGESRAVVRLLRIAPWPQLHGHVLASLQDNWPTACPMTKGSPTLTLQRVLRQKAAELRVFLPWVESPYKDATDTLHHSSIYISLFKVVDIMIWPRFEQPEDVDLLLMEFRTEYELSRSKHTLLVAAVEFFFPHLKGKMLLCREALRGRTNADHIRHTITLPKECAHVLAAHHASSGHYRLGAAVLPQQCAGLRPTELLGIRGDHVFIPVLKRGAKVPSGWWSVVSTKVKREQCVLIQVDGSPLVCKLLNLLRWLVDTAADDGRLSSLGYSFYNSFKLAEQHFGLQAGRTAHSGRAGFATNLFVQGEFYLYRPSHHETGRWWLHVESTTPWTMSTKWPQRSPSKRSNFWRKTRSSCFRVRFKDWKLATDVRYDASRHESRHGIRCESFASRAEHPRAWMKSARCQGDLRRQGYTGCWNRIAPIKPGDSIWWHSPWKQISGWFCLCCRYHVQCLSGKVSDTNEFCVLFYPCSRSGIFGQGGRCRELSRKHAGRNSIIYIPWCTVMALQLMALQLMALQPLLQSAELQCMSQHFDRTAETEMCTEWGHEYRLFDKKFETESVSRELP